jgi:dTMP kinase
MSGKLIVIEGLDGSGKHTQSMKLYERLSNDNQRVMHISFPRYSCESSSLARMYLSGEFGDKPDDVSAYVSSTFFAVDRYAAYKTEFGEFYDAGGIVVADRYTTSNMLHQACKIADQVERTKYLDWLWDLEFRIYGIPVPHQVFFLDTNPEFSIGLLLKRNEEQHTKGDIHELDTDYLNKAYSISHELVAKYGWVRIDCMGPGGMEDSGTIHSKIYDILKKTL